MGAPREMGWHESCVWGFALPAVVQSIHGPASAAPVAVDPRRVRVLHLRAGRAELLQLADTLTIS